jgi:transcriptional regulator GlxA family with amidase domain
MERFANLRDRLRASGPADLPLLAPVALALIAEALAAAPAESPSDPLTLAADLLSSELPLPPQQAAARIGMNYESFRRQFRKRFGVSPAAWGLNHRLDRACSLLTSTDLPVADIARRLGYANPFAFTNRFSSKIGRSPSAFRHRGR